MSLGRTAWASALLAVLMGGISAGVYALWLRDVSVVEENHLVEWSQVVLLVAAAAIHASRSRQPAWPGENLLRLALALLCISFAVREVDIDRLTDSQVMPAVQMVIRSIVVGAWLVLAWKVRAVHAAWWERKFSIARSGVGVLTFAGCLLYAASWPFDKFPEHFGTVPEAMLYEETIQLHATLLLFLAAWQSTSPREQSEES